MTKEEKIKEEYLKLGLPFNENIIFDNGWLKIKPGLYSSKYDDLDLLKMTNHVHSIRPKTLQGLENNNGWTKIENESDLPTIGEYYTIASFDNSIVEREFPHPKFSLEFNKEWWLKHITHYQQIIKPENPLY